MKTLLLIMTFGITSWSQTPNRVYSAQTVQLYLNQISSILIGRGLNDSELSLVNSKKHQAISEILHAWMQAPTLGDSAKMMLETQLGVSGSASGVDWNYPGYLARHIVRNNMPYSNIITADFCVNASDQRVACDSGAPYAAGVLTTRGYLLSKAGRFNLSRAHNLLHHFACLGYPMARELEPAEAKNDLLPMFQVNNNGGPEFGNGTACYSCHSQFSSHAQFFVKFDKFGVYQPTATGIQQTGPGAEGGLSDNNTYASHFANPAKRGSESSKIFGKPAANLREAAIIVAESKYFLNCAIRNTLRHVLKMTVTDTEAISEVTIESLAQKVRAHNPNPSWQNIVETVFNDPIVIESTLRAGVK